MEQGGYHRAWRKISRFIRYNLYGGRCMFCGAEDRVLACIHLDQRSENNDIDNLGCACWHCHSAYDRSMNIYKRRYGKKFYLHQLSLSYDH